MAKLTLVTTVEIDSAHYLSDYSGKCGHIHGHRWKIEVTLIQEDFEDQSGMLVDFGTVKRYFDEYDHAIFFETGTQSISANLQCNLDADDARWIALPFTPTAENLSLWWAKRLAETLNVTVQQIKVWETPTNMVCWTF
jgi:6-pyruvoyltetrahydropterin/6-carboxytetrahydropterin synthase